MRFAINQDGVKKIMEAKGWDEKQLAENMGISHTQVYRVMRGQREPGNEFIASLYAVCKGSDLEDLFLLLDDYQKVKGVDTA